MDDNKSAVMDKQFEYSLFAKLILEKAVVLNSNHFTVMKNVVVWELKS